MNERDFCFWLKGFFEMTDAQELSEDQLQMVKEHLDLVFVKVTETVIKAEPNVAEEVTRRYIPPQPRLWNRVPFSERRMG